MAVRQVFRENLKYYRKKMGISQEKLSELIGYGETYITEIESRRKFPKPETIDIIAQKLGIEPYELFKPIENAEALLIQKIKEEIEQKKDKEFDKKLKIIQAQINDLFDSVKN